MTKDIFEQENQATQKQRESMLIHFDSYDDCEVMPEELIRYLEINQNVFIPLVWRMKGYHRCRDWDFMIIGPEHPEYETCNCKFYQKFKKHND